MLDRSPSTSFHGSVLLSSICSTLPPPKILAWPLPPVFEALQQFVLDLHVPGEIVFAGLQHRPRRRHRIAAALHLDRVEIGAVRHVIVRVDLAADDVARLEVDEHVRTGADRREICRRLARAGALVLFEQVLRDDRVARADKRVGPERRRLFEVDLDRQVVDFGNLDVLIGADRRRRGGRIGGVLPVEHAVIGGKRLAVVPFDARFQFPDDPVDVLVDRAALGIRDLGGEDRHQIAVGVPSRERLVEDARAVLILGADREMRVQQGRALPPQELQCPAAAGFGRRVFELAGRHRDAAMGEHLGDKRSAEAERHHLAQERPSRALAGAHLLDLLTQLLFVDHRRPLFCQNLDSRRCGTLVSTVICLNGWLAPSRRADGAAPLVVSQP